MGDLVPQRFVQSRLYIVACVFHFDHLCGTERKAVACSEVRSVGGDTGKRQSSLPPSASVTGLHPILLQMYRLWIFSMSLQISAAVLGTLGVWIAIVRNTWYPVPSKKMVGQHTHVAERMSGLSLRLKSIQTSQNNVGRDNPGRCAERTTHRGPKRSRAVRGVLSFCQRAQASNDENISTSDPAPTIPASKQDVLSPASSIISNGGIRHGNT